MNRREIGSFYENLCIEYLKKDDFEILEHNYRCKLGEIDIIARKDGIIRFIEVKYRKNNFFGYAINAVDKKKQNKIMRAAMWYLQQKNMDDSQCSFDIMTVENDKVEYYFNCYGGI